MTVFERADRIGGLLRYGIPEFKMEKRFVDRRLAIMEKEGVVFRTGAHVGVNVPVESLRRDFDALVLAGGACWARDLPVPGRELRGIHFAMEYLPLQNRRCEGDAVPDEGFITARGKRVVIIGGGDTGADCLGTVHRQGAVSVHQFEVLPRPPDSRAARQPLAPVAQHPPRLLRPRGGRRARLRRLHPALHRRRRGPRPPAPRGEGRAEARRRPRHLRAHWRRYQPEGEKPGA